MNGHFQWILSEGRPLCLCLMWDGEADSELKKNLHWLRGWLVQRHRENESCYFVGMFSLHTFGWLSQSARFYIKYHYLLYKHLDIYPNLLELIKKHKLLYTSLYILWCFVCLQNDRGQSQVHVHTDQLFLPQPGPDQVLGTCRGSTSLLYSQNIQP